MIRSLLSIRHGEPEFLRGLVGLAAEYKARVDAGEVIQPPEPKTVGLLFFEGSTRTRVSFEQACHYLGYRHCNFSGAGSSMSKGESLKDTILTLRFERLDALVMRHRASGSAQLAAQVFEGPTVNAGDGQHEHPTQAIGDALTVLEHKERLDGLVVTIVGDIEHSRVARSNIWMFNKLGCEVRIVGPRALIPRHPGSLPAKVYQDLPEALDRADVVMALRLQQERMDDGDLTSIGAYRRSFQINHRTLRYANRDAIVMHPGPMNRGVEIDDWTADGPQCVVLDQVENGIFARMAALSWVLGHSELPQAPEAVGGPA